MDDTELLRAANGKSIDVAEAQKTNPIILRHSVHQRVLKWEKLTHLIRNTTWNQKLQSSINRTDCFQETI